MTDGRAVKKRGRRVLLSVTGIAQNMETAEGAMHLVTTGTLTKDGEAWRLRYRETQPDTDISERVTLTMDEGQVTMEREGGMLPSLVFRQGRRFEGNYETPEGNLDMGVFPSLVRYAVDHKDLKGEVALRYQLDIQGKYAATHELLIRFAASGKS